MQLNTEVTQREIMVFFKFEQSKLIYRIDFALYTIATLALAFYVLIASPPQQWLPTTAFVLIGLISWTAIEYALHRFILHALQPFRRWHAEHHRRPKALICAPTILSASLIATFVYIPALLVDGFWHACALTLGVLIGYIAYTITHHAIHHWHFDSDWLRKRKRLHAVHHHYNMQYGCYGVTSAFWDYVFDTTYQHNTQVSQPLAIRSNGRKTLHKQMFYLNTLLRQKMNVIGHKRF